VALTTMLAKPVQVTITAGSTTTPTLGRRSIKS
jgi:hypothetical protein